MYCNYWVKDWVIRHTMAWLGLGLGLLSESESETETETETGLLPGRFTRTRNLTRCRGA